MVEEGKALIQYDPGRATPEQIKDTLIDMGYNFNILLISVFTFFK